MNQFNHSVSVPGLFKHSAKILEAVHKGGSLKQLLSNVNRYENIQGIQALVAESIKYDKILTRILERTNILKAEPRFDPWIAKILITELIYGKKRLNGNCKPILTVLKYKEDILKQLVVADVNNISSNSGKNGKGKIGYNSHPFSSQHWFCDYSVSATCLSCF